MAPFAKVLPDRIEVTILTDRGFADAKLFGFLDDLGFGYVIRFRPKSRSVRRTDRHARPTSGSARAAGHAGCVSPGALWEHCGALPGRAVVCVHARGMKEAWCLAASDAALSQQIIDLYSSR
jgi:hypothetical protein